MSRRHARARGVILAGALASTLATQALAQGVGQGLSEGDFLREIPPVVTASRLSQLPQDAPGVVTVLDREFIEAVGARDVVDLLRHVPGFFVGMARGGQPVATYHGLSGEVAQRIQVIVDGRSLYGPYLFGGIDWSALNIDLADIDRIEVVRGSNSSTFGSNAFLGVVSITTRSAAQSTGSAVYRKGGSNGIRATGVRLGTLGDDWGLRLSAGVRGDGGLEGLPDARRQGYVDGRAEFQLSGQDSLVVQAGASRQRQGLGFFNLPLDPERTGHAESRFGLLRWHRTLDHQREAILTLSHTADTGADEFDLFISPGKFLNVDYGRRAERTALNYWQTFVWSPRWRSVLGAEARRDTVRSPQLFNTSRTQAAQSLRGYFNTEWQPSAQWTINLGASLENESNSGRQFAPRAFINYKPLPNHTLKVGQSSAFRTPSLFEQRSDWRLIYEGTTLHVRFLSSGNLVPERVEATELVYQGQWPGVGVSADARLFRERIQRLITSRLSVLPPGPDVAPGAVAYDLRNRGEVELDGLEYRLQWSPSPRARVAFSQFQNLRAVSDQTRLLGSIPDRAGSLMAALALTPQLSASYTRTWLSGLNWIGEPTAADPQILKGLRLAWRQDIGQVRTEWAWITRKVEANRQEFRELQRMPNESWLMLTVSY